MTQQFHSWVPIQNTKHTDSKDTCSPVLTAALLTVAKIWKQSRCPATDEWEKEDVVYTDNGILLRVLSRVRLCNPMDCIAHQAPLSTGFSRQEYWGGLPFPPPGDLPDPGTEPMSPALAGRFFTITDTWEAPVKSYSVIKNEMLPVVTI